eukprot:362865-Chlamydomonas_euryale.AAC.1
MAAGVSEALYVCKFALFTRTCLDDGFRLPGMVLHCDNMAAKMLAEDQSRVKRCKHVAVTHHFAVNRAKRGISRGCPVLPIEEPDRGVGPVRPALGWLYSTGWKAFHAPLYITPVVNAEGLKHVPLPLIVPCMTAVTRGSVGISSACCPLESLSGAC